MKNPIEDIIDTYKELKKLGLSAPDNIYIDESDEFDCDVCVKRNSGKR